MHSRQKSLVLLMIVFNMTYSSLVPDYLQFPPEPEPSIPLLEICNKTSELLFVDIINGYYAYKVHQIKPQEIFHLPHRLEFDPFRETTISIYNDQSIQGCYSAQWEIGGKGKTIYVDIKKKKHYILKPQKGKQGKTEISKLSLDNNISKDDIIKRELLYFLSK